MTIQIPAAGPAYASGLGSREMKWKAGSPAPARNAGMNAAIPTRGSNRCRNGLNAPRRKRRKYTIQATFSRM